MAETGPLAHSPTLAATAPPVEGREDQLPPGAAAGDYLVDRFLGAGAMGDVYAGHHPVIGKKVAIKVLKHEATASPEAAERFIREARAVNQVDHPNVIDVFAFGRLADGRLYLVMELVEGKSLRRALSEGPLDLETALYILDEVAQALDAAHQRGVVHRDLKPDNVMLGPEAPPKVFVLDFGLAKLIAAGDAPLEPTPLTGKGTWLGTPAYMAPEQWSADGAGPASDRYSLGVMAFELLSGQLPFQAGSLPQMMEQHFRSPVPALSSRGAIAAHATFDPTISRAMAKDPEHRFGSGREMVDALRAAVGRRRPSRSATGRRRQWVPVAAGAGVLGLAIAAFFVVRAQPAADRRPAAAPRNDDAPRPGEVRAGLITVPAQAEVWRDGRLLGTTPLTLAAQPGEPLALDLRKPGYAPVHQVVDLRPGARLPVIELAAIKGFEGVWALPDGELRAFTRVGDRVDAFKLDTVAGERSFYRHYEFTSANDGVAFASTEEVVDPRAPGDPACHIPHRTEYRYDPGTDELSAHPERVEIDVRGGHCVIVSKREGVALALTRVDRGPSEVRISDAPVGLPPKAKPSKPSPATKTVKRKVASDSSTANQANVTSAPEPMAKVVPNAQATRGDAQVAPQVNEPPPPQEQAPIQTPPQPNLQRKK